MVRFLLLVMLVPGLTWAEGFEDSFYQLDNMFERDKAIAREEAQTAELQNLNRQLEDLRFEQDQEIGKRQRLIKDLNNAKDYSNSRREYQENVSDAWKRYGR